MSKNNRLLFTVLLTLVVVSLFAACGAPAATTQAPSATSPALPQTTTASVPTIAPTTTAAAAKPQGDLIAALTNFGNESFLPWADPSFATPDDLVYDILIYWDHINYKFFPGLAESWEVSPDGLTLTYHLRKGVQFSDGWGELTSEDVKYNFEMQASKTSVGKVSQTRRIVSMDTPDPYTLVVHFKDPFPTFWVELSVGNSGTCQGIVCKKYVETVGVDVAASKPIGTGPYKVVDSHLGDYYKFEALDTHWRVVPEFRTLTIRLIPETSSLVAALKNKEIDCAMVPTQQLSDLKAAGVSVELSATGGNLLSVALGGMVIPEDKRYDAALDNKDPWTDTRVRKAMAMAIDRQAIAKAIYAGYAEPVGVPVISQGMDKFQYPYDPAAAKQLLKDAGYPEGFTFKLMSYKLQGAPESSQIAEALAGYWQQIGLDPKITVIDYNTYNSKNIQTLKTAGGVYIFGLAVVADALSRVDMSLMPNGPSVMFQDAGSYAIWNTGPKGTLEERNACMSKLQQYYYDNVGPIPVIRVGNGYAWNSEKMLPWPHPDSNNPSYFEYVRHVKPLNTFRLFSPWPDR